MWADVNALKKEISLSEKERSEQKIKKILNEIEGCTDKELARFERIIMERRGRAAAHAIIAPIGTAQPSYLRSRYSGISFDGSVCIENIIEGKIEPELGKLGSSSAGTGLEAPGKQCLSNWEMKRITVDGCSLIDGSSDLGETTISLEKLVIGTQTDNIVCLIKNR